MNLKVIIGTSLAGAFGYLAAKIEQGLDKNTSIGVGLAFALIAGLALSMSSKKEIKEVPLKSSPVKEKEISESDEYGDTTERSDTT